MGEGRVVGRPVASSATHTGSPPISMTRASAIGRSASSVVTPNAQSASRSRSIAVPVKVIAGCRASGSTWCARAGSSTADPVPAAGVHDHLAGLPGAGGGQPGDEVGERVVGHREEHELGAGDDRGDVGERHAGQQVGGAGAAGVGHGVRPGDPVAGPRERRPEHGADPAGTDDTHGQPGRVLDAVHGQETYPSSVTRVLGWPPGRLTGSRLGDSVRS